MEPRSRSVLDTRVRGYDGLVCFAHHAMNHFFFVGFGFGSGFNACGSKPI
jgi:hypothetical protein